MRLLTIDLILGTWTNREWPDRWIQIIAEENGMTVEEFVQKIEEGETIYSDVYAFAKEDKCLTF